MTGSSGGSPAAGLVALEAAASAAKPGDVNLKPEWALNMELSHLEFQDRVVDMAADPSVPLLERVRFVSILGSNLDEFFMTRVAGFKRQIALDSDKKTLDGLRPGEQLREITAFVRRLMERVYGVVIPEIEKELAKHGIGVLSAEELSQEDLSYLQSNYIPQLDSVVTPLWLAPGGLLPHVRNLRPALMMEFDRGEGPARAVVELPGDVPSLVPLPGGRRFIPLEDVIRLSLPRLIDGHEVSSACVFRVTRSGNLMLDPDSPDDLIDAVAETVARRPFQPVVRLEVEQGTPEHLRSLLLEHMSQEAEGRLSTLDTFDVFEIDGTIDLERFEEIASLPIPELRYPPQPRSTPLKRDPSIFEQLKTRDVLVRFPDHSFERTVERFIQEAAVDPAVEAIGITLYRTNRSSKVVKLLRRAHQNGKRVLAMIEVKASFDERRNIEWARMLEAAGISVLYGPPKLKVHAKIASVKRAEPDGPRLYSYLGTGNLNAATAAAYTDLGLLTADPEIGRELEALFDTMSGEQRVESYDRLIVAPFNMRSRFLELIRREAEHAAAGRGGQMTIKLNGIADREIISELYKASGAGVKMDLICRGLCSLRPGVPGVSENIRVFSIVGRYLEHSRIYRFHNAGDPEYFIGSADWRGRNLSRRVEVVTPVDNPTHRATLDKIIEADLDSPNRWELLPDGSYVRRGDDGR